MTPRRRAWRALILLVALLATAAGPITASASWGWNGEPWRPATALSANQRGSGAGDATPERQPIFGDDFEAYGDLSRWHSGSTLIVQQDIVYGGVYAARGTATGGMPAYARKQLSQGSRDLYYRMRFLLINQDDSPVGLLGFRTINDRPLLTLGVSRNGLLGWENVRAGTSATSALIVTHGGWHEVQVHLKIDGSRSQVEVWYDGLHVDDISRLTWIGDETIGGIDLGDASAGRQADMAFDDVVVDSAFIPASMQPPAVSGRLTVRAIPPWPGIAFQIDGKTFVSDDRGVAVLKIDRWSATLRQRVLALDVPGPSDTRASFSGWHDWTDAHDNDVVATFVIKGPITFSFVDLQGKPVDPAMITSVSVRGSTGVVTTIAGKDLASPQYLQLNTASPTPTGLRSKPMEYSVEQVVVNGANVVNRAQQRFKPGETPNAQIKLLFYAVQFTARDAFFGSPIGQAVKLQYPDGTVQIAPLSAKGQVVLPLLPRGEYQVSVIGSGFSPPRPITLSRSQAVDLEVVSRLDMALAGSLAVAIALGLLLVGRPVILRTVNRTGRGGLRAARRAARRGVG